MARASVEIRGIEKLQKDIIKISQTKRLRQAMGTATATVLITAKTICPKDTGRLTNSIHMSVENQSNEIVGKVATNVEYAPYVEFGTGIRGSLTAKERGAKDLGIKYATDWAGQEAQPFMYPALKQNQTKINRILKDALRNEI